ncbi:hypothetical protein FRC00_013793 [Tulasnella sp. 408]|nr:hypothetical protein FRC00_013793 [Tulasnella sp. 408]
MSSTVNVVRYTGLIGGILYGISHRRTLQEQENHRKAEHAAHHREDLIKQARQAWKDKQEASKGSGLITNPDDPNFDLEKILAKWEAESK